MVTVIKILIDFYYLICRGKLIDFKIYCNRVYLNHAIHKMIQDDY